MGTVLRPTHDLSWFDRLGELVQHERRAEAERCATLQRALTLNERAARGDTLTDLVVTEEGLGFGGRVLLLYRSAWALTD